jgi:dTDP-4-dehydrorhamnose 3,5-epimerase-like enzyme
MLKKFVEFPKRGDDDGWLVALEAEKSIPFPIRRVYYIFGTRPGVRRGRHAHRQLRQVLVCLAGRCTVLLDDGRQVEEVALDGNERGLVLDPMVWHEMHDFSPGCVLLVLADAWYDETDYIRDYRVFKELAG